MEQVKPYWASKTLWFNLVLAIAAFWPTVHTVILSNEEYVLTAIGLVNVLLRVVTSKPLGIPKKKEEN